MTASYLATDPECVTILNTTIIFLMNNFLGENFSKRLHPKDVGSSKPWLYFDKVASDIICVIII